MRTAGTPHGKVKVKLQSCALTGEYAILKTMGLAFQLNLWAVVQKQSTEGVGFIQILTAYPGGAKRQTDPGELLAVSTDSNGLGGPMI